MVNFCLFLFFSSKSKKERGLEIWVLGYYFKMSFASHPHHFIVKYNVLFPLPWHSFQFSHDVTRFKENE